MRRRRIIYMDSTNVILRIGDVSRQRRARRLLLMGDVLEYFWWKDRPTLRANHHAHLADLLKHVFSVAQHIWRMSDSSWKRSVCLITQHWSCSNQTRRALQLLWHLLVIAAHRSNHIRQSSQQQYASPGSAVYRRAAEVALSCRWHAIVPKVSIVGRHRTWSGCSFAPCYASNKLSSSCASPVLIDTKQNAPQCGGVRSLSHNLLPGL